MNQKAAEALCQRVLHLVHKEEPKRGVLEKYWTDVLHDTLQLIKEGAPISFLWCVRGYGTHLFRLPLSRKEEDQHNIRGAIRFVANSSWDTCYIWHIYTSEAGLREIGLSEVFNMLVEGDGGQNRSG